MNVIKYGCNKMQNVQQYVVNGKIDNLKMQALSCRMPIENILKKY